MNTDHKPYPDTSLGQTCLNHNNEIRSPKFPLDPMVERIGNVIHQKQLAMPPGQSYNLFCRSACYTIAESVLEEINNDNNG